MTDPLTAALRERLMSEGRCGCVEVGCVCVLPEAHGGPHACDPPYIVSDERLMEIRQLLVHDEATPVAHATRDALAAAVFDLLAERDDRTV
jgi:hypothetical protein